LFTPSHAIAIAIAIGIAIVIGIANADVHADAIARQLENLKIFKDVNLTVLIARLTALKAKVPDKKQP
jgi:D-Tyr-tRNAtyr deacylase